LDNLALQLSDQSNFHRSQFRDQLHSRHAKPVHRWQGPVTGEEEKFDIIFNTPFVLGPSASVLKIEG
jgi:hypothetical protein